MSKVFKKQFKTKYKKDEMRNFINKIMQDLPALKAVIERVEWQGDSLLFVSKIGDGFFAIEDYYVLVEINLNFVGSMAKSQIEAALDSEFLKLNEKLTDK